MPARANRQPAVAFYNHGEAMALDVIRIEEGMITEVIMFPPSVFEQFGLPSRILSEAFFCRRGRRERRGTSTANALGKALAVAFSLRSLRPLR